MNWDCNPKQRFTRNHLEKCYTTSKNNRPVEKLPEKGGPMGYKKRPRKEPYWNFWRAGWLIRYPMQILKGIGTVIVGLFLFGVLVMSPSEEVSQPVDNSTNSNVY
jgi:hypothetical protein